MSLYAKFAQKEHSFGRRVLALLPAGVIFLILLPYVLIVVSPNLDQRLGLEGFQAGAPCITLAALLMLAGVFFAWWSIYVQLTRGRGTPLPVMPTQELLIRGPFAYCRNPMTLGTILAYLGLAIIVGTVVGIAIVLILGASLLFYLKRFEEGELAERFGDAYLAYKREVPFIIPRLPKKKQSRPAQ
jgi:protein-S-isoprenylcysteine O-methyltransferase Ste14